MIRRKLLAVGSDDSGKTELLHILSKEEFDPNMHIPSMFSNVVKDAKVDDCEFEISLWDINVEPARLRPFEYPDTDIVLMCFSTKLRNTFEEIEDKWVSEVKYFCPNVPIMLVGNHTKRSEDEDNVDVSNIETKVSADEGRELGERIGAIGYLECCAKKNKDVEELFDAVSREVLQRRAEKKRCIVQ